MDSRSLNPSLSNCGYTVQKSSLVGVLSGQTFEASNKAQRVIVRQLQGRREMLAMEINLST